jgi:RAB protein geranylgeranyltransferase component A
MQSNGITYEMTMNILTTLGCELQAASIQNLTTKIGIKKLQNYLKSIGRYGSGALISGNYGTGSELCQAFCRFLIFKQKIRGSKWSMLHS